MKIKTVLGQIMFLVSLTSFSIFGLLSAPRFKSGVYNYFIKQVELGNFKTAKVLIKTNFIKTFKRDLILSLMSSHQYSDYEDFKEFFSYVMIKKEFSFLKSENSLIEIIKITTAWEVPILEKYLGLFLDIHSNVGFKDDLLFSPAHYASGNLYLLLNDEGKEFALFHSTVEVLKLLHKKGANLNLAGGDIGITPLMIASYLGDFKAVKFILSAVDSKDAVLKDGSWKNKTALDLALMGLDSLHKSARRYRPVERKLYFKKVEEFNLIIKELEG